MKVYNVDGTINFKKLDDAITSGSCYITAGICTDETKIKITKAKSLDLAKRICIIYKCTSILRVNKLRQYYGYR